MKKRWKELYRLTESLPVLWGIIFLCWLPAFLASWPGVYVIDNAFQMKWFLDGTMNAHHPVIHTWLLGMILSFGNKVLGSYEAGLGVFSILQMLFLSGVFACVVKETGKTVNRVFALLCAVFFSVMPYHAVSAFTSTKDTVFAGLFLLTVLRTWWIVNNQDVFFRDKKQLFLYGVLIFLMCAFRNTGIYIFMFTLPAFLIVCRKYWKKVLVLGCGCILAWSFFTGPVYQVLQIEKGSSAEILSVPMQQLARTAVFMPEELTLEEMEEIKEYMPEYHLYAPRVSDPVKDTFRADLFEQDPLRFVRLWIQVGVKHPGIYMEAFFETNIGFWNPFVKYPDSGTFLPYIPYQSTDDGQFGDAGSEYVFVERHSLIPWLASVYEKLTESGGYNRIPGMTILYSAATAFWLIIAAIIICIRKKRYQMAVPFFLLIGLWGTLMLSPVVVFRYGYPLIICIPVVYAMCFGKITDKGSTDV